MATPQPFLFDTRFDTEGEERARKDRARREAELEAARRAAYADGVAAGRDEAEAGLAGEMRRAVDALADPLAAVMSRQEIDSAVARKEAVGVAAAIMRKLFPRFEETHGLAEIEALVLSCLEELATEPRLVVRVRPDLAAPMKENLNRLASDAGYPGALLLVPADDLKGSDARVEWAEGGAARDASDAWARIDQLVEKALQEAIPGARPTATAETEA